MGYIDSKLVTIDAVVTEKGRELLPKGVKISRFAVADDEIDYELWDPNNTNGSIYYGQAIEDMSLIEANPNQDATMRHKLISLAKNVGSVPTISLLGGNYSQIIDIPNIIASTYWIDNPIVLIPKTSPPQLEDVNYKQGYKITVFSPNVISVPFLLETYGSNARGGNLVPVQFGTPKGGVWNDPFDPIYYTEYNMQSKNFETWGIGTEFRIYPASLYGGVTETVTVSIEAIATSGKFTVSLNLYGYGVSP